MRRLLLTTALIAGAAPAYADNISLFMWNGAATEVATGTDAVSLQNSNIGGVTISLSTALRNVDPNQLTESNITVFNNTASVEILHIIAGANDYTGPSTDFALTGTVGVGSGRAELQGAYVVDGANTLNGTNDNLVGTSVGTFDTGQLTGPQSMSENLGGVDDVSGPYGMAGELTLTMQPNSFVFVNGLSMTAEPVPGPTIGAGLPGLVVACGVMLTLRRLSRINAKG